MYNEQIQNQVNELLKQNVSFEDICKKTGVSLRTIKRWKEMREERLLVKKLIFNKCYNDALEVINFNLNRHNIFKTVFLSSKIKIFLKQGHLVKAENLARTCLIKNPGNEYFESQLISSLIFEGKLDEAEKLIKLQLEKRPNNIPIKIRLFNVLKQQCKLDEAEKLAYVILEKQPDNFVIQNELKEILLDKEILNLEKEDNDIKSKNILFTCVRNQEYDCDNFNPSIKNIKKLKDYIENHSKNKLALLILAEAYFKIGLRDMAINTCKKAIYSENITIEELKVFKQMIEISKSKKPVFDNTIQKINILVRKLETKTPEKNIKK